MAKPRRSRKRDHKGREIREPKFVQIPDWERRSAAWRYLARDHAKALVLYIEFKSYFNGSNNNGQLFLSVDDAVRALGGSKSTISRAFELLEQVGFIKCNKRGCWIGRRGLIDDGNLEERQGKATTYWLTAVPRQDQFGKHIPESTTKEFMSWRPPPESMKSKERAAKKNRSVGTVVGSVGTVVQSEPVEFHHGTERVA